MSGAVVDDVEEGVVDDVQGGAFSSGFEGEAQV